MLIASMADRSAKSGCPTPGLRYQSCSQLVWKRGAISTNESSATRLQRQRATDTGKQVSVQISVSPPGVAGQASANTHASRQTCPFHPPWYGDGVQTIMPRSPWHGASSHVGCPCVPDTSAMNAPVGVRPVSSSSARSVSSGRPLSSLKRTSDLSPLCSTRKQILSSLPIMASHSPSSGITHSLSGASSGSAIAVNSGGILGAGSSSMHIMVELSSVPVAAAAAHSTISESSPVQGVHVSDRRSVDLSSEYMT
mmetsp:Transcript_48620/g.97393  ORF Transcript_48620/g.97393 Transcript_48620/m.97393 type:complete len:253 (+) Transcript_48620:261-1019(+)